MAERKADPSRVAEEMSRRPEAMQEAQSQGTRDAASQFMNTQSQVPVRKTEGGKYGESAEHTPTTVDPPYNKTQEQNHVTKGMKRRMRKALDDAGVL